MSQLASLSREIVFAKLEAVDQTLDDLIRHRLSLAPDRDRPTRLRVLAQEICGSHPDSALMEPEVLAELGWFLLELSESIALHFPENIFWDLDYVAHDVVVRALRSDLGPRTFIEQTRERMRRLVSLYGVHGEIRFRYAHDFLYGFDWARWVERDAANQAEPPFGTEFLDYSRHRGHQLLELIDKHDTKYPPIGPDDRRNPFGFSRDPEEEQLLHEALAKAGHIPVQAWDPLHEPRSGEAFSTTREEFAERMGLSRDAG